MDVRLLKQRRVFADQPKVDLATCSQRNCGDDRGGAGTTAEHSKKGHSYIL